MSILRAMDATRICARWSTPLADPTAWMMATPSVAQRAPEPVQSGGYSWWSLSRNPSAILLTAIVGTVVVKDAAVRVLMSGGVSGLS